MTTRITWKTGEYNTHHGFVGTQQQPMFTINWHTVTSRPDWNLRCGVMAGRVAESNDCDELKATAEQWFADYLRTLGVGADTPKTFWTVSEIGDLFGIKPHGVDRLRRLYGNDRTPEQIAARPSFPTPDIVLGVSRRQAGWDPARKAELLAWRAGMPGRGAGGGRKKAKPSIWTLLADAGINIDLVSCAPDGVYSLIDGDTWIAFGETDTIHPDSGRPPTAGWDLTLYARYDDDWHAGSTYWAPTVANAVQRVAAWAPRH